MERWMGSRTARWVIVLGAALLALRMGLTKYRLGAEEAKEALPKARATPRPEREALRYGGKNFDQWRVEMETELKPEIRVDGLTAMAAFGANGYASEATRTIVDVMSGYDLKTSNTKDKAVVEAAGEAIGKIGKAALPVLWEGVRSDHERSRLFAMWVLGDCLELLKTDWRPPVAELLKAAGHEDKKVREMALMLLQDVRNKPNSCLPVLLECLNDKEPYVREKSLDCLDKMRPEAREVMSALRAASGDSEPGVRFRALCMAGHYGAKAKPFIPALLKELEKPDSLSPWQFGVVMDALTATGPAAREALPRLRKLREEIKEPARAMGSNVKTYREIIDQTIEKLEGK